jgi:hypothetical protein
MQKQESIEYFYIYEGENEKYGLRYAIPEDAEKISRLYVQEYDYNYINPKVYDPGELQEIISEKKNIWIVGENLKNQQIFATSLMELKENYAFSSKTIIDKDYRGLGLGSRFGFRSVNHLNESHIFDDRIKIDSDVRAVQIEAQKLTERAGGIPYGFIPFYNNFGDKRKLNTDYYKPYPVQNEESAFLYFVPLTNLIENRVNRVFLLDDELISPLYNLIKNSKRIIKVLMKKDDFSLLKKNTTPGYVEHNDISVSIDMYGSKIKLVGVSDISVVNFLLNKFKDYRMLIWHIPTTQKGVKSMQQALEEGFIVCGYNVGSFKPRYSEGLIDSLIFVKYLNDISKNTLGNINLTSKNKPFYEHVITQL